MRAHTAHITIKTLFPVQKKNAMRRENLLLSGNIIRGMNDRKFYKFDMFDE